MKTVDYKITVWRSLKLEDSISIPDVIAILKEYKDIDYIIEMPEFIEDEILYETEERLMPEDNDAQATIEVYNNNVVVWNNIELNKP